MPLCNCGNCAFFKSSDNSDPRIEGDCRRKSPSLIDESFRAVFPTVQHHDYCGEWESWEFWNMKEEKEKPSLIDEINRWEGKKENGN